MRQRLRIPSAIAFAFVAGCSERSPAPPTDSMIADADAQTEPCPRFCIQIEGDPVTCPPDTCWLPTFECPSGCMPEPAKRYCLTDQTRDAGCPGGCVIEPEECPDGCITVG